MLPKMLTFLQPIDFPTFIRIILIVFPLCLVNLIEYICFIFQFGQMFREVKCLKLNVIYSYSSVSHM